MKEILHIDEKYKNVILRHESKVETLQKVVDQLLSCGLPVTIEDLTDLINSGDMLYRKMEAIVSKESEKIELPLARQSFYNENISLLNYEIQEARQKVSDILVLHGVLCCHIDAYTLQEGIVSVSEDWKAKIKNDHTTYTTESRKLALEKAKAVENAVAGLNDMVKGNPAFHAGILSQESDGRSLCYLDSDGSVVIQLGEFINL